MGPGSYYETDDGFSVDDHWPVEYDEEPIEEEDDDATD